MADQAQTKLSASSPRSEADIQRDRENGFFWAFSHKTVPPEASEEFVEGWYEGVEARDEADSY